MTYEQIKKLKAREFKRLCGVKPQLFKEMTEILEQELPKPKQRGGQPKLSIEDQLLIALEYWREYRTYFHIGQSWGIHESTVCRIVHRVENKLIKSRKFSLPGKKALSFAEAEWSVVIVDVGESPIERPKKNSVNTTAEKAMQRGLCERKCSWSRSIFHSRGGGFPHERLHQERKGIL